MANIEKDIEKIIDDLIQRHLDRHTAVKMITGLARGGRILVIDENLFGLEAELSEMNYTVELVDTKAADDSIKKELKGRVLITNNGKHFNNPDDLEKYYYGLIWVMDKDKYVYEDMAEKVKEKLMESGFEKNLRQIVKVI